MRLPFSIYIVAIYAVRFDPLRYAIQEDSELAQLTLVLDTSLLSDITIQLFTTNGSAFGKCINIIWLTSNVINFLCTGRSIDYDSGPYNVTFHVGEISATLNISIKDDEIIENNEYFNVIINATLLPNNVVNVDNATVTIMDDDGKWRTTSFDIYMMGWLLLFTLCIFTVLMWLDLGKLAIYLHLLFWEVPI